jgi:hypothetical protein
MRTASPKRFRRLRTLYCMAARPTGPLAQRKRLRRVGRLISRHSGCRSATSLYHIDMKYQIDAKSWESGGSRLRVAGLQLAGNRFDIAAESQHGTGQ